MGAPVPPPFLIHLGIDEAIKRDIEYWKKETRRQSILAWILISGHLVAGAVLATALF